MQSASWTGQPGYSVMDQLFVSPEKVAKRSLTPGRGWSNMTHKFSLALCGRSWRTSFVLGRNGLRSPVEEAGSWFQMTRAHWIGHYVVTAGTSLRMFSKAWPSCYSACLFHLVFPLVFPNYWRHTTLEEAGDGFGNPVLWTLSSGCLLGFWKPWKDRVPLWASLGSSHERELLILGLTSTSSPDFREIQVLWVLWITNIVLLTMGDHKFEANRSPDPVF